MQVQAQADIWSAMAGIGLEGRYVVAKPDRMKRPIMRDFRCPD